MRKLVIFIVLVILSIFVYFNCQSDKNVDTSIKTTTFPPEQYLDKLEDMKVQ